MKRIITLILSIALICTSVIIPSRGVTAKKHWWNNVVAQKNSIKVKWAVKKKATQYQIYRAVAKKPGAVPKKNKFKRIKIIKNTKTKSYTDKRVKKGKFYSYYVKAVKGKKEIANTYDPDFGAVVNKGLTVPEIHSSVYKDCFYIEKSDVVINVSSSKSGYKFTKNFKFYRREENEKKYKPIKLKMYKRVHRWKDTNVQKGRTYYYKAKCYLKKKKKIQYSGFSEVLKVHTCNYEGKYKVKTLTESGVYKGREKSVVLEISNASEMNGKSVIKNTSKNISKNEAISEYVVNENGGAKFHSYEAYTKRYSYDNSKWFNIPSKGIELKGDNHIFIEILLKCKKYFSLNYMYDDYSAANILFGGNDCKYNDSHIKSGAQSIIKYYGPVYNGGNCTFDAYFDLKKGLATARNQ